MSNWRALADEALGSGDPWNTRNDRNKSPPSVPTVPTVPPLDQARALPLWRSSLASLDWEKPLHRLDRHRWRQLLGDAHWLLEHYAGQAARDGWSAADLFGLLPSHDGWAGIADRLRSSRSLVMTADTAKWRRLITDTPDSYARGVLPGLKPLWESQ